MTMLKPAIPASSPVPDSPRPGISWEGLSYLLAIYFIWGSTYLAIRVAVRGGFPPFMLGATRLLLAGAILMGWAMVRRQQWRLTRREIGLLAISGVLLWTFGNGLVLWAEQYADSGYAALLVSTTPIWVAIFEAILDRRVPTRRLTLALLVGFSGIVVLSVPQLRHAGAAPAVATNPLTLLALLVAPASWAAGSVFQQRRPVEAPVTVRSAYQHLFGALGFAVAVLLTQEPRPTPTPAAWTAFGYLVIVGSLIGFTSFLQALRLLPINIAMTYAYVNPVVAVALGWLILSEPITVWMVAGSVLVLLGVAGVFRERYGRRSQLE